MEMTDKQICYKTITNGGGQKYLLVLAELNNCSVDKIETILQDNGLVKINGKWKRPVEKDLPKQLICSRIENTKVERKSVLSDVGTHHVTIKPDKGIPDGMDVHCKLKKW